MQSDVVPLVFSCEGDELVAMLHTTTPDATKGVLVVVGGPQYRAGSHRQFVHLARHLAAGGYPVLRFDYRGMGDSDGDARDFEMIAADIRAAADMFMRTCPSLRHIAIFGLCDAASAAIFYAPTDPRVTGLILLNPWVRTEQTLAGSYVRTYYSRRIFERDFWAKLLGGHLNVMAASKSFLETVWLGLRPRAENTPESSEALPARMLRAWRKFRGHTLLILSGRDLTAGEFEITAQSDAWREALSRKTIRQLRQPEADHTFSRQEWKDWVASACLDWLRG
jgi:exosortase A-associated hydrolase 1